MTEQGVILFHICRLITLEGLRTVWGLMAATNGENLSPSVCVSKSKESLSSSWLYLHNVNRKCGNLKVMRGWDQGILGNEAIPPMQAGGKRTLKIPANLGYGERGAHCR